MVTISTTSLELSNANENNSSKSVSTINIYDTEDPNTIDPIQKESRSEKLKDFIKRYLSNLKVVFKSIIPDIRSFKWWQSILLLLFATFNVVFSVLVCFLISYLSSFKL